MAEPELVAAPACDGAGVPQQRLEVQVGSGKEFEWMRKGHLGVSSYFYHKLLPAFPQASACREPHVGGVWPQM